MLVPAVTSRKPSVGDPGNFETLARRQSPHRPLDLYEVRHTVWMGTFPLTFPSDPDTRSPAHEPRPSRPHSRARHTIHSRPRGRLRRTRLTHSVVRLDPRHHRSRRSEEQTSEIQSLMRNSYAVFCLK